MKVPMPLIASSDHGPWDYEFETLEDGDPYATIKAGDCGLGDLGAEGGFQLHGIMTEAHARLLTSAPRLQAALEHLEWRARVIMDESDGEKSPSLGALESLADAAALARDEICKVKGEDHGTHHD